MSHIARAEQRAVRLLESFLDPMQRATLRSHGTFSFLNARGIVCIAGRDMPGGMFYTDNPNGTHTAFCVISRELGHGGGILWADHLLHQMMWAQSSHWLAEDGRAAWVRNGYSWPCALYEWEQVTHAWKEAIALYREQHIWLGERQQ